MAARHQAGLHQSCRRASLLVVLETVSCLLPGPHILGESWWSRPDPNPCGQVETFLGQQWGLASMPSPPGGPGWKVGGSEAPAPGWVTLTPTGVAEPQS